MNLKNLFHKTAGAMEEFHVILDNWHVPRSQGGIDLGLAKRAAMLLNAIECLAPALKEKLQVYWRSQ